MSRWAAILKGGFLRCSRLRRTCTGWVRMPFVFKGMFGLRWVSGQKLCCNLMVLCQCHLYIAIHLKTCCITWTQLPHIPQGALSESDLCCWPPEPQLQVFLNFQQLWIKWIQWKQKKNASACSRFKCSFLEDKIGDFVGQDPLNVSKCLFVGFSLPQTGVIVKNIRIQQQLIFLKFQHLFFFLSPSYLWNQNPSSLSFCRSRLNPGLFVGNAVGAGAEMVGNTPPTTQKASKNNKSKGCFFPFNSFT